MTCLEVPVALKERGDWWRVPRCYQRVWEQLGGLDVDLLHTHGYLADIVGIPVAWLKRIPTVTTCHGFIASSWKVRLYNSVDRKVLRLGTRVLAVSDGLGRELVDSGVKPGRVQVLMNAIETEREPETTDHSCSSIRRAYGIDREDIVLGYVGRLSAEKGLNYLIEACAQLIADGVPARALLIGEGVQREDLGQLSYRLGIADRVIFAGFQEDVSRWLSCMDVFVLPSLTEGTPMALLEAMAAGVPSVASAVGGIPKIIDQGETGLLVAPGSASEIKAAVEVLFKNPDVRERMASRSVSVAKARYGVKSWIERIEREYEILAQRGRRETPYAF